MHRLLSAHAPLVLLLGLSGCSLTYCDETTFARDASLYSGEIQGVAMLEDVDGVLAPAPYAQVKVRGTGQFRRADSEGKFVVWDLEAGSWVLQVTSDDDGDGLPDRRRVMTTILREAPHRQASIVPGTGGEEARLTGVDIGEVLLEGTAEVGGSVLLTPPGGGAPVPPSQLSRNVVVLAGRNFDLPKITADGFDPVSLGAEARTHVDDDGFFLLRNLGAGSFYLVVLVYEQVASLDDPARLKRVSPQVFVRAIPDGSTALDAPIVLPAGDAPATFANAQVLITPVPDAGAEVYLFLAPPGREFPDCEFPPPDLSGVTAFSYVRTSTVRDAAGLVTFNQLPVGSWDMKVCSSGGSFGEEGILYDETLQQLEDGVIAPLLGPVLVGPPADACLRARRCNPDNLDADCPGDLLCRGNEGAARCGTETGGTLFDCDGDGRRGLPRLNGGAADPNIAIWGACVTACTADSGGAVADATCTAGDVTYDCDDDGDGQSDVTESPQCYGPGKGGDADSDGLCDPVDAFPECRANTAAACEAGVNDEPERLFEDTGPIAEECSVDLRPAPPTGQRFAPYCGLMGDPGGSCGAYEMECNFESADAPFELAPRHCTQTEDCAPAPPGSLLVAVECNPFTELCEYIADEQLVQSCDDIACSDLVPLYLCSQDVDIRCRTQPTITANMPCVCTRPDGSSEVQVAVGLQLTDDSCSLSRAIGLWTDVCGFPAPVQPDVEMPPDAGSPAMFDAGPTPDVDAGSGGIDALCTPPSAMAACTGGGFIEYCSFTATGLTADCGTYDGAVCGEYPCVASPCNYLGDACLAPEQAACNTYASFDDDPRIKCAGAASCRLTVEVGAPSTRLQVCEATDSRCSVAASPTCSTQNTGVLEFCRSLGGDVPEVPLQLDCEGSGGACVFEAATAPHDACISDVVGGYCDPNWDLDTPGSLPFLCNASLGLTCTPALLGTGGTCDSGV